MSNMEVFISYKAEELAQAKWVKDTLESNGISCWMAPDSIPGGSSYAVEIPKAIKNCKAFVLILSNASQSSKWVSREVDLAINEGKLLLPFAIENCTLQEDFSFYLTNVQRYAAYENKTLAAKKMVEEIRNYLSTPDAPPAETTVVVPKAAKPNKKYDTKCIVSFVFGLLSLVSLGTAVVTEILAMLFAVLGARQLKANGFKGKGLAVAGLVMGILTSLLGFVTWFSVFGLVIAIILSAVAAVIFYKAIKE